MSRSTTTVSVQQCLAERAFHPNTGRSVVAVEVFLLISKVLLTGFVVFADPGSSTQVVYSIFIATVTLYVYAETKPFVSDR